MAPSRRDLAWAAGLFEGEGCFTIKSDQYKVVSSKIAMTDLDVLEKFMAVVGFGTISGPEMGAKRTKPVWRWETGKFEHVQALIAYLWPWLGIRRRARALEVLSLSIETTRSNRRRGCINMFGKRLKDLTPEEKRAYQADVQRRVWARRYAADPVAAKERKRAENARRPKKGDIDGAVVSCE